MFGPTLSVSETCPRETTLVFRKESSRGCCRMRDPCRSVRKFVPRQCRDSTVHVCTTVFSRARHLVKLQPTQNGLFSWKACFLVSKLYFWVQPLEGQDPSFVSVQQGFTSPYCLGLNTALWRNTSLGGQIYAQRLVALPPRVLRPGNCPVRWIKPMGNSLRV